MNTFSKCGLSLALMMIMLSVEKYEFFGLMFCVGITFFIVGDIVKGGQDE